LISLLIVDDHPVVIDGIRSHVHQTPDMTIAGVTGEGLRAGDLARQLDPTVIILDLVLPDIPGLVVLHELRKVARRSRVVVVTRLDTEQHLLECLRTGAYGYVVKDAPTNEVLRAVRAAVEGRHYLSAPFNAADIDLYLDRAKLPRVDPLATLTVRERQVLCMVANGLTNPAIADRLFVSERTVETHRENMLRKLGLEGIAAVVDFAYAHGLKEPPQ